MRLIENTDHLACTAPHHEAWHEKEPAWLYVPDNYTPLGPAEPDPEPDPWDGTARCWFCVLVGERPAFVARDRNGDPWYVDDTPLNRSRYQEYTP